MSERAELLRMSGVCKTYGVGTPVATEVLHSVDLAIGQGEFVSLIGPSGSGKSTLLNIIGLLEPMSSGEYLLQGRSVASLSDTELTRCRGDTLGFVFQFHHLLPAFSALENVLMPALIRSTAGCQCTRTGARFAAGAGGRANRQPRYPQRGRGFFINAALQS